MPQPNIGLYDTLRLIKASPKPGPNNDSVFFTKDQLKVGSILRYYGRHAPNTVWEVTSIRYCVIHNSELRSHKVTIPQTLQDQVKVKCRNDGTCMELSFQYLSYSAIWRLEQ